MTRDEFIQQYAPGSNISRDFACLGFVEFAGSVLNALPCACGADNCVGWAMVGPALIDSHLRLYAPDPLRSAYIALLS
jgi:hypothetical protein